MKKIILSIIAVIYSAVLMAQCIAPNCSPANGYCAVPDTITNLPQATVASAYSGDIRINVGTTAGGGAITINSAQITSISGLPASISPTYAPVNATIPGGSNMCINLSGTPTAGEESGGPNNDGLFPLTINVTLTTNMGAFPTTITGYKILVNPGPGSCTAANCSPTNGYCAQPDTIQNLPIATVNNLYINGIKVNVASTLSGGMTIDSMRVVSIVGLPASISPSYIPTNALIPGGDHICIMFSGIPVTGDASGGPNGNGIYPLTINVMIKLNSFGNFPTTISGYKLIVSSTVGIQLVSENEFVLFPNPAQNNLNISSGLKGNQQIKITDMLGRLVKIQNSNMSNVNINIADLSTGIYCVEVSNNENKIVKKFVKD